jgi:hypothetical protein
VKIFVSYRREDRPETADRVAARLRRQFGQENVFKDLDSIDEGENFLDKIQAALGVANVLVVVIGPGWLNASNRPGKRRLDDPDDWVRIEIREGLQRDDMRVIPLVVDGAQMPGERELPPGLKSLANRHARTLRPGASFECDLDKFAERISRPDEGGRFAGFAAEIRSKITRESASRPARLRIGLIVIFLFFLLSVFVSMWIVYTKDNGVSIESQGFVN